MVSVNVDVPVSFVDTLQASMDYLCGRPRYAKHQGPYSVRADPSRPVWTHSSVGAGALQTVPFPGCDTVFSTFQYAVAKNGTRPAVGQRALIKTEHVEDPANPGKTFEKLHLASEYTWLTYNDLSAKVEAFATGLVAATGVSKGEPVVIYAETKADWMVAAQSLFRQSAVVTTIYATLGAEGVRHGLNQTHARVVITDAKLLASAHDVMPQCMDVKHIVTIGQPDSKHLDKLKSVRPDIQVHVMEDLVAAGKAAPAHVKAVPPKPDDKAVIMYTSGTTGAPKGVVISHKAVCASMAGLKAASDFTCEDVYLAYLPLAHIMEMAAETVMMAIGCSIGYGSPQTLIDTGLKLASGVKGDAPTLKPTFMVFAPTVLDRVRTAVTAKFKTMPGPLSAVFHSALAAGYEEFDAGRIGAPPLWNLPMRLVQKMLGGRVRVMVSGSAPLSSETQKFVQTVFNCPVRQGYGLTETCSAGTIGAFDDNSWNAGRILVSAKIKLLDWEEGNYRVADEHDPAIGVPRGEILVGGPIVADGYFQDAANPDAELDAKNKSDFSVDPVDGVRYFHTGDIGEVTANGCLRIVDRKKDLVKLQMGEYVALSKVENALKLSPYVEMALCYALSTKSHTVALICPNPKALVPWGEANGMPASTTSFEALCASPAALEEVKQSCIKACKSKLAAFETPTQFALVADPWTPDNDCLTAAMKLKRQVIQKRHAKELAALYK